MTVDLSPMISQVAACTLLNTSVATLVEQLAMLVEGGADPAELAAALRFKPPVDSSQIGVAAALTKNTSHISVERGDPLIDSVRQVFESPVEDRPKHIALIDFAIQTASLDLTSHLVELNAMAADREAALAAAAARADAAQADADQMAVELQAAAKAIATKDADVAELDQANAQKASLLAQASMRIAAQVATLEAKAAQVDAVTAQRDATQAKLDVANQTIADLLAAAAKAAAKAAATDEVASTP